VKDRFNGFIQKDPTEKNGS